MRKFLTVLASGALVLSMSAPAFAAMDRPHNARSQDCRTWDRHHHDGMHRPSHCRPGR
jgi:hypothetical protein